jgi:hypothetical protein
MNQTHYMILFLTDKTTTFRNRFSNFAPVILAGDFIFHVVGSCFSVKRVLILSWAWWKKKNKKITFFPHAFPLYAYTFLLSLPPLTIYNMYDIIFNNKKGKRDYAKIIICTYCSKKCNWSESKRVPKRTKICTTARDGRCYNKNIKICVAKKLTIYLAWLRPRYLN